ncbi:MAG TPA: hypothetical protein DHW87_04905 [Fervidobacterium sp.]|nr:hypothetical protein [Fervidobacterium sp.]MBP8657066.1 hypothetical protein [Fervidobacterium sp.]MBP9518097.1 hypothetical protein [Fervidobacterium sp.]HCL99087.1 hypothetical protein [Fervidobacterium sp.]HOV53470.1 hypothetical protein [Fervidobacterium sp.]
MTIFNWLIILSTVSTVIFAWATFLVQSFRSKNEKSDLDEDEERLVELMGKVRVFVDSKMELLDKKTEEVRKLLKELNEELVTISALSIDKNIGNSLNIDKPTQTTKNEVDKFVSEDGQKKDDIDSTLRNISSDQKSDERNSRNSIEKSEDDSIEERIFEMFLNGMEPVEIAKTLKMGVGEVSLIIDLMKRQHH